MPVSNEWTHTRWPVRTLEYYSAMKRGRGADVDTRRSARDAGHTGHAVCDSPYVKCPDPAYPQEQEVGAWLSGAGGGAAEGDRVSFGGDGIFWK